MTARAYKFSRSKNSLSAWDAYEGDGWAGTPYWLVAIEGAAAPVLPASVTPAPNDAVAKNVRAVKRALSCSMECELGEPYYHDRYKTFVRQASSRGNTWPFLVNAQFTDNVERAWPDASWHITAHGRFLRVTRGTPGRSLVKAVVMALRPASSSLVAVESRLS